MDLKEIEFIQLDSKPDTGSILNDLESLGSFGGTSSNTKGKIKLGGKEKPKKEKKKKDKEKKKKKDETPSVDFDFSLISNQGDPNGGIDIDVDLNDVIDELFDEDGNPIADPIIDEQRKGYKKRKNDKNPYKKEFAEEMTLLYDVYSDVSGLAKELEKSVKSTQNSRVRGTSKNFNETISNLISARSTQLQILKEMTSVKKTIADLRLKEEAKKGNNDDNKNQSLLASNYLQQVLNAGRNNFVQQIRGTTRPGFLVDSYLPSDSDSDDGYGDDDSPVRAGTLEEFSGVVPGYTDDEEVEMNEYLLHRLEEEGNPFRSDDGDKLIQYEKRGVEVCIKRDLSTGEYEFIAVDRDNQIVHDYPLPSSTGKIKFNGHNATDRYGVIYKVIEYDSAAFSDDDY